MYILDANIFIRDVDLREPEHDSCHALIERLRADQLPIVVPLLLLPGIGGALSRRGNNPLLARVHVAILRDIPTMTFLPMDDALMEAAATLAADYRLRGADAVYVVVAQRAGTTLVTLDDEQRRRAARVVTTRTPNEVLAALASS